MDQKSLGKSGYKISGIGLGCVTFGREIDEETAYRIMDYAVEKDITFFDTAEAYGGGQARAAREASTGDQVWREVGDEISSSERIIGTWMESRGCRDLITVCTKVSTGGSTENIPKALTLSLERLRTNHVEIYKMHSPDKDTPIEETLSAMTTEVVAGRVKVIGCSNYSAVQIQEALDVSADHGHERFEVTQPPYNLATPQAQEDLIPLCIKEKIAVTPHSPLGSGFLTGKYTPDRTNIPARSRFDTAPGHIDIYFSERNFRVIDQLSAKCDELGIPITKLAMAWAMTNPGVTSVLIGARETRHIDNALEAYSMGLDLNLREEMTAWD